jgi:hypothetical protein
VKLFCPFKIEMLPCHGFTTLTQKSVMYISAKIKLEIMS